MLCRMPAGRERAFFTTEAVTIFALPMRPYTTINLPPPLQSLGPAAPTTLTVTM